MTGCHTCFLLGIANSYAGPYWLRYFGWRADEGRRLPVFLGHARVRVQGVEKLLQDVSETDYYYDSTKSS